VINIFSLELGIKNEYENGYRFAAYAYEGKNAFTISSASASASARNFKLPSSLFPLPPSPFNHAEGALHGRINSQHSRALSLIFP